MQAKEKPWTIKWIKMEPEKYILASFMFVGQYRVFLQFEERVNKLTGIWGGGGRQEKERFWRIKRQVDG